MVVYSHSRLSCFEQCPFKFQLKYLNGIKKDITTVEAFMGTLVHEVLEKLYKDVKHNKQDTIEDLLKEYNKKWKKAWNDNIRIVRKDYTAENYRKMGEKYISDYYNRHKPFNHTKTLGLEMRVLIKLDTKGKYRIQGYIDRLALAGKDTIEIHDYKTSGSLPTQEYLDNDRQLALYAIAVKEMYPFVKKIKLIWHFLAFDVDMVSTRTEKQLEELKKEIVTLINAIEEHRAFEPKESALCDWCEYQEDCPLRKHMVEVKNMAPLKLHADDGVTLVTKYVELKKKADEATKKLETVRDELFRFAEQQGIDNIAGKNGVIARLRTYTNLKMPNRNDKESIEEIKSTLEMAGILDKFMVLDTFNLGRAINNNQIDPKLSKEILKFADKTQIRKIYLSG